MPKLWNETIASHRNAVRDAILETSWTLVAEHGLRAVTMSKIAEDVGIGRATLYKYFPDVEAILVAYHEQHVAAHLEQLAALRNGPGSALDRLSAVLERYAFIAYRRRHGAEELGALLHRDENVACAEQRLVDLFQGLLAETAAAGSVRDDIAPAELAPYCLHALAAAGGMPDEAAVRRLVSVTLVGLHSPG